MAGKASKEFREAMKLVMTGEAAQKAAYRKGLHPTSMYRNAAYKAWIKGDDHPLLSELKEEMRALTQRKG